jgi:hypothetical protein
MYITETINRKITVANPVSFCENLKENVLLFLKNNYIGRCFNDGYITKVFEEGLELGDMNINVNNKNCEGTINVKFLVEKDLFSGGKCFMATLDDVKNNMLHLSCKYANVLIPLTYLIKDKNKEVDLSNLKVGQIIPVTVINRKISIASTKVLIDGRVLVPYPISYVFNLTGEIPQSLDLNRMINYAESLQEKLKKHESSTKYEFIKMFLYGYKSDRSKEIDKTKKQTIMNIANGSVKVTKIVKDARINWVVDPCVLVDNSEQMPPDFNGTVYTLPIEKVVIKLLLNQIYCAEVMLAMIETYSDEDIKKNYDNYWKLK